MGSLSWSRSGGRGRRTPTTQQRCGSLPALCQAAELRCRVLKRSYQSTNQLITDRQSVGLDVLPRELFSRNRGEGKLITAVRRGSRPVRRSLAMSRLKQTSKTRGRKRAAVTALGVAGALSLASGASASIAPAGDLPTQNAAPVILAEEEISDVSLATFFVFDKENARPHLPGVQLARGCGHGCGHGCGCRGCAVHRGCGGCGVHRGCRGCVRGCAGCGGCGGGCCIWIGGVRIC